MKEYLLPVGLILLDVAIFLLWRVLRRANPWSRTPYEQQDAFLSPAELAFYQVLDQLVGEDIAICPKPAVPPHLRAHPQDFPDRRCGGTVRSISTGFRKSTWILCCATGRPCRCCVRWSWTTAATGAATGGKGMLLWTRRFVKRSCRCFISPVKEAMVPGSWESCATF